MEVMTPDASDPYAPEEIGRRIAKDNARNKIWALEGYLLRSKLAKTPSIQTI